MREKLIELLKTHCKVGKNCHGECVVCLADHLIANGVTIQKHHTNEFNEDLSDGALD